MFLIGLVVMSFALFVSCSDDDDSPTSGDVTIPDAPEMSFALHPGAGVGSNFIIIFPLVSGATEYRLYQSADGTTYTGLDTNSATDYAAYGYGFFSVSTASDTYFYIKAYNSKGEGGAGPVVFAEPSNFSSAGSFISYPASGQTIGDLTPTFTIASVGGASMYAIGVYTAGGDVWDAVMTSGLSCTYGETTADVVTFGNVTALTYGTYGVGIEAINSNNWGFLKDDNSFDIISK